MHNFLLTKHQYKSNPDFCSFYQILYMKLFITGGTGFIGTATVAELVSHGHEVVGLARSDASAAKLKALGASSIKGDLEDLEALKKGASEAEGVLHLGFIHNFAKHAENSKIDFEATSAMLSALKGTNKPFVYTSGTASLSTPPGVVGYETDRVKIGGDPLLDIRKSTEQFTLDFAKNGVRTAVVRLPPSVHGKGDNAFVPALIATAEKNGFAGYVEAGTNVWLTVHRLDAAKLFRLAAEKAEPGTAWHGVQEGALATKDIAAAIAKKLGVKTQSVPIGEVVEQLGFVGHVFSVNNDISSKYTQEKLNWKPTQIHLFDDIAQNY